MRASTFSGWIAMGASVGALVASAYADAPWVHQNNGPSVPSSAMPGILKEVGFDQHLGVQVPPDLVFHDEQGADVRLGDLVHDKPAVLALVYYQCPMLCTLVLNGLVSCLEMVPFDAGREFQVVVVSFDPTEGPELARQKKATYLKRYGHRGTEAGWRFLTGREENIHALADAVGFRYTYDEQYKQYAHASGIVVLTPDARVSRYFYGVEYPPRDLRLGLVEASEGKIGSVVDQVLLYCFHYDPATGKYGAAVIALLRIAGAATVIALAVFLVTMRRRERHAPAVVRGA